MMNPGEIGVMFTNPPTLLSAATCLVQFPLGASNISEGTVQGG